MNNIKTFIILCTVMAVFIGCATPAKRPESIGPIHVSPVKYTFYNCDQIKQEYNWLVKELCRLTGIQNKVSKTDSVLVFVSIFIIPVPLTGGHSSVELGLIKGNIIAIENIIVDMDCGAIKKIILENKKIRISNEKTMEELMEEKRGKKARRSGKSARRRLAQ